MLDPEEIKRYCTENDLFTAGTQEQFERALTLPLHDIATVVWICSETDKHATEIEHDLVELSGGGKLDW